MKVLPASLPASRPGVVIQGGRFGTFARNRIKPVDPRTTEQVNCRAFFAQTTRFPWLQEDGEQAVFAQRSYLGRNLSAFACWDWFSLNWLFRQYQENWSLDANWTAAVFDQFDFGVSEEGNPDLRIRLQRIEPWQGSSWFFMSNPSTSPAGPFTGNYGPFGVNWNDWSDFFGLGSGPGYYRPHPVFTANRWYKFSFTYRAADGLHHQDFVSRCESPF